MKFVCDRCQTRYSIADEKVRQKILRIRCKTCGNVIVVQGKRSAATGGDAPADDRATSEHFESARTAVSSGPKAVPSSAPKAVPSSAPKAVPSSAPKAVPSSAPKAVPSSAPRAAVHGSPPPPPAAPAGTDPLGGRVEWYLAVGGVRSGPFSRAEAARRIISAAPGKAVHVWKEGMPGWKPSGEVSVIARELNLLRPPPPPPPSSGPAKAPSAPPSSLPPKVAAMPPTVAKAAKAAHELPASLFPGKPLTPSPAGMSDSLEIALETDSGAFSDITTKKAKDLHDLSKESDKGSFADSTTKKGKNLGAIEAASLSSSAPAFAENDRTPPPVHPLPPVAAKAKPSTASSSATLPVVAAPAVSFHQPGIESPAASSHAMPVVPAASTGATVPPGQPELGGFAEVVRAVAASDPPSSPMQAFASSITPSGSETSQVSSDFGFLGGRRPGLKYVVAAGAIVVLVILIVMVTLRMDTRKVPDVVPAPPSTTMEPATLPESKPVAAKPPKPVPVGEEKPASAARATGKHGSGRSLRRMDVSPASGRQPSPKSPAKPVLPERPNPFDETKTVSQSQISAVVRNKANQDALKSCYERALKMDNHLTSGRIDVTVSIATSGVVQRVVIDAPSSFILVEPCIKSTVKRWVFPPNVEEYGTNFPLIMQGGM